VKQQIPFFVPWITDEDEKAVVEALNSRWLTGGPKAVEFEKMFANYIGINNAISVNSCTSALHLAMRAIDIGPGDEVIVPVLTFAAVANAPIFCGAKPVLADVDEKTYNILPEDIMNKITDKTKAVIVVHHAGQPCDMKEIAEIAEDNRLHIIEDCAHSLGASYVGRKTGSIGTTGCFSFYPTKNITTLEGGMVTTNDSDIARKMILLREHAITKKAIEREKEMGWYYDVIDLGYNYRLNEIQAALGTSQLRRIKEINKKRIEAANRYTARLSKIEGIIPPYAAPNRVHVYHLYVIKVIEEEFGLSRDELFVKLSKQGIGLSVHYTPLHLLSFYKKTLGHNLGDFPNAERAYKQVLSLPLFPTMTQEQIDYVAERIMKGH